MPNWKKLLTSGSNIQISELTLDAAGVTKASIDTSGNIFSAGNITVAGDLIHSGDTDTKISFTNDDINITVGNVNMLDFTEDSTNEITFNEGGVDVNVRMEGNNDQNLFFLDAGNDRIGVGLNNPSEALEVSGNIKASDTVTALTGSFNVIEGGVF